MTAQVLTKSRREAFQACPRLHDYAYERGYRPAVEASVLRFGTLWHRGLEAWWDTAKLGAAPEERATAAVAALHGGEPYDVAKAAALIRGYTLRWGAEPYEVLGVEVQFSAPLRSPTSGRLSPIWRLAGKLDAVVRDPDGRTLIVEAKSSSEDISAGSDYWLRLRLNGQVSAYYAGARTLGLDVWGCLYDVARKPALRPYEPNTRRTEPESPEAYYVRCCEAIAEDPARYFARGEVVRLDQEMRDFDLDAWQVAQSIREAERLGRWPRNPEACVRYNRVCPFLPVCIGQASLDDGSRYRRTDTMHEELAAAPT